ncbi:rhodanese-like domain-containing protein [Aquimarina algiphila]|uniref:Rhodanese-like domain-containing protein n=1 Tax=Aquimarina algiphila TaxID=2047982 RepID=A0A554VI02_9FLAO|nr:rhodanese-like domain-containing protein [Aquimarina algiphila]TSE07257.1 rhodanese-like domain-containing protein [Aquimarina algiphila]
MSIFNFIFKKSNSKSSAIKILDVSFFKKEITENKDAQLIDVRTPKEYNTSHIKNAININYFERDTFQSLFQKLNKQEPIYIYCRSGNRSRKAAKQLSDMGFVEIKDLKGGYLNWK